METVSKYLIYALVDPRTKEWRYIGKSSSGLRRPKDHAKASELKREAHIHKTRWIQSLINLGLKYEILVLEEFENNENLYEAEHEWITEAKRIGVRLTNHSNGGSGMTGYRHTAETKARLSLTSKGRVVSEETRLKISIANTGKHMSEESKIKMSVAKKGKPLSKEHRATMSLQRKGRPQPWKLGLRHSEETKAKISLAHQGKVQGPHSEETKAKISSTRKRKPFIDSCGNVWQSTYECAPTLNVSPQAVRYALKKEGRICKGRTFKYI